MKLASFLILSLCLLMTSQSFAQKGRAAERRTGNFDGTPNEQVKKVSNLDRFVTACETYDRSSKLKDEVRMEHRERSLIRMMQDEVGESNSEEESAQREMENAALEARSSSSREEQAELRDDKEDLEKQSSQLDEQRTLLVEFEGLHKKYDRASIHRKREILREFTELMEADAQANKAGVKEDNREVRKER